MCVCEREREISTNTLILGLLVVIHLEESLLCSSECSLLSWGVVVMFYLSAHHVMFMLSDIMLIGLYVRWHIILGLWDRVLDDGSLGCYIIFGE